MEPLSVSPKRTDVTVRKGSGSGSPLRTVAGSPTRVATSPKTISAAGSTSPVTTTRAVPTTSKSPYRKSSSPTISSGGVVVTSAVSPSRYRTSATRETGTRVTGSPPTRMVVSQRASGYESVLAPRVTEREYRSHELSNVQDAAVVEQVRAQETTRRLGGERIISERIISGGERVVSERRVDGGVYSGVTRVSTGDRTYMTTLPSQRVVERIEEARPVVKQTTKAEEVVVERGLLGTEAEAAGVVRTEVVEAGDVAAVVRKIQKEQPRAKIIHQIIKRPREIIGQLPAAQEATEVQTREIPVVLEETIEEFVDVPQITYVDVPVINKIRKEVQVVQEKFVEVPIWNKRYVQQEMVVESRVEVPQLVVNQHLIEEQQPDQIIEGNYHEVEIPLTPERREMEPEVITEYEIGADLSPRHGETKILEVVNGVWRERIEEVTSRSLGETTIGEPAAYRTRVVEPGVRVVEERIIEPAAYRTVGETRAYRTVGETRVVGRERMVVEPGIRYGEPAANRRYIEHVEIAEPWRQRVAETAALK